MLGNIVGTSIGFGLCHVSHQVGDVVEGVSIIIRHVAIGISIGVARRQERCPVVVQLAILEEAIETVFLHHQQVAGHVELIAGMALVADAREDDFCGAERIVLVVVDNLIHGDGHFGEDTSGSLDVCASVVVDKLAQGSLVVGDMGGLQHFLSSGECDGTHRGGGVVGMKAEINAELASVDVGHASQSARVLEVETWTNLVDEGVRVVKVGRVLEIFSHDESTVIIIGVTLCVGIFIVEHDANVLPIVATEPDGISHAEVAQCVSLLFGNAVGAHEALCNGVEVGVVVDVLLHGLAHLACGKGHRGEGVAVER